jgi:hypothetical protein
MAPTSATVAVKCNTRATVSVSINRFYNREPCSAHCTPTYCPTRNEKLPSVVRFPLLRGHHEQGVVGIVIVPVDSQSRTSADSARRSSSVIRGQALSYSCRPERRGERASMMRHSSTVPWPHWLMTLWSSRRSAARSAILRSTSARCSRAILSTASHERRRWSDRPSNARTCSSENPRSRARRRKLSRPRCFGL